MPPPSSTPASSSAPSTLPALLESTQALLSGFQSLLSIAAPSQRSNSEPTTAPTNPLSVLADAAKLLKAHSTKLGLLLLNKPFTLSAVAKVLSEITGTCIPAMMGAVELLGATNGVCWGSFMERQVKSRVGAVVGAVGELVKDVERVSRGETAALTTSSAKLSAQKQKDSTLASTGQVWSTCDALMSLGATSPADILVKKAEEYRALLRDAIDELKEWAEDEDEGFDDGEVSDQDSDVQFGPSKCPRDKPEIKAQIDIAVKKLRLVDMGYKAVEKRRLKTFPFEDVGQDDIGNRDKVELRVKRLDKVMSLLGKVPEEVDELAGKFYELDETGADAQLQRCCDAAITAIEAVKHGWDERPADPEGPRPYRPEDKTFPDWVDKWMLLLQQG